MILQLQSPSVLRFTFKGVRKMKARDTNLLFPVHCYPNMRYERKNAKETESFASSAVETWSISDIESMFQANVARAQASRQFQRVPPFFFSLPPSLTHTYTHSFSLSPFALLLFIHLR